MTEENKIDGFIKRELNGYSPEVPPSVWENIALPAKEKKAAVYFWLVLFK